MLITSFCFIYDEVSACAVEIAVSEGRPVALLCVCVASPSSSIPIMRALVIVAVAALALLACAISVQAHTAPVAGQSLSVPFLWRSWSRSSCRTGAE
jgi:hypothetical protein